MDLVLPSGKQFTFQAIKLTNEKTGNIFFTYQTVMLEL